MSLKKAKIFCLVLTLLIVVACERSFTPKPRGYFRIDLPEKEYKVYESDCPYSFEYPDYAVVLNDTNANSEPCWINIFYPRFNAEINITYKEVNDTNLQTLIEDSWTLLQKHNIKAEAIKNHFYTYPDKNIFGVLYEIKGNAASSFQFVLTDSTNHYLRGALYFFEVPNKDSIGPVAHFIHQDVIHMMESFEWK